MSLGTEPLFLVNCQPVHCVEEMPKGGNPLFRREVHFTVTKLSESLGFLFKELHPRHA